MDNLKRTKRKKSNSSVDGFVANESLKPRKPISRSPIARSKATGHIGRFKSSEGFYPTRQSQIKSVDMKDISRKPDRNIDGSINLNFEDDYSAPAHSKKTHRMRRVFSSAMIIFLILSGFAFGKAYMKFGQIFKGGGSAAALGKNVDPARLNGEGDGRVNILLLGKGGDGHIAPDLTDTIVVASINPIQKEAALLSIPRDTYVKTSDYGSMRINAVYSAAKAEALESGSSNDPDKDKKAEQAGLAAADKIVEETIGIPIHYHAIVDFNGFKKAIDTVGGVDLNVTDSVSERMWLDGRNYYLDVEPGLQHFDGFRALAYSRSRQTSNRGDFDRSERQRAILVALKDKTLSAGTFSNPVKISQLLSDFGDHVSSNLSVDEMMRLLEIGQQIESKNITSVSLVDEPNVLLVGQNIGGASVQVPKAGIYNFKEIQAFVRSKLKDGYLADENASVLILNGTYVAGLAGRTVEELQSYGYNLAPASDAPSKGYQDTVIVDLRSGQKKYTKRYLEQRFKTSTVDSLPDSSINPGNADFVIILGQNEVSRLEN